MENEIRNEELVENEETTELATREDSSKNGLGTIAVAGIALFAGALAYKYVIDPVGKKISKKFKKKVEVVDVKEVDENTDEEVSEESEENEE